DSKYSRACADSLNAAAEYAAAANALGVSLEGAGGAKDSLEKWNASVRAAEAEFGSAGAEKRKPDRSKLVAANAYLKELRTRAQFENPDTSVRTIPSGGGFASAVNAMLDRKISPEGKEILALYAGALDAVAHGDESLARAASEDLRAELSRIGGVDFASVKFEHIVNAVDPFFCGFILYALAAALLALSSARRRGGEAIVSAAAVLLGFAVAEHVFGICARMYIQARPPVTNLYSSVVFAGAAAALVGYLAYLGRRETVYALAAAVSGLLSLLVAMNLPHSGDTMGMMRAVLNSNFWLTIHVVTIMIGYCGLFLAGFMAELRLVANVFSRENFGMLTAGAARGVYAVLCFSLVFSFAGTMLGGIWADMSWGRFWGWDPKENGALMVVLWTAAAIHAKTLRLCSDRVFLALAAFGNVVGAWAWFGVNLMGVGLHSYGFVEGGWKWFFIFVASQIAVCPLAFFKYREKTAAAPKKMLE
ncbi:MAG: cytochrome c biogenesis protein CcsA, partial [Opitutales bacterium]|nr:cytochrome c biogenesis protein CcsA [Opitutales bacterium]